MQVRHKETDEEGSRADSLRLQLEDVQNEFREFTYRVSHEVHAPLRSAVNFAVLLEREYEKDLSEEVRNCLHYVVDGVKQAQALLNGLLEYSRIDTLGNPPERVDCNYVLECCQARFRANEAFKEARTTIEPLPELMANPAQLETLFYVLIDNAVRYRDPARRLEIHIFARRHKNFWLFTVADNGSGLAEAHQQEAFQLFLRFPTPHDSGGIGLGLALAEKIVKHHGGRIWMESEPGVGTRLYFMLPAIEDGA